MALATSVHDLRTLIRSCHPLIVIETVEEERVLALLQSVAAQERMPLFEWSITKGLTRADDGFGNLLLSLSTSRRLVRNRVHPSRCRTFRGRGTVLGRHALSEVDAEGEREERHQDREDPQQDHFLALVDEQARALVHPSLIASGDLRSQRHASSKRGRRAVERGFLPGRAAGRTS